VKRIYRMLLKLYPARFREEYSGPLERQFHDDYRELGSKCQRAWFWLSVLSDLAFSIPAEICREVRQDLGYALRVYRSRRLVTSIALGALALAIGAATGVFSVVNAVLLRSLPFREPQRLVEIWPSPVNGGHGRAAFYQWRKGSSYLDDAAPYSPAELNLNLSSGSIRVRAAQVSANFFTLLGAPPEFGRDFRPEEDGPGAMSVAILGHALWQQVFGRDPRVLGSAIHVNGVPLTVIGVARHPMSNTPPAPRSGFPRLSISDSFRCWECPPISLPAA